MRSKLVSEMMWRWTGAWSAVVLVACGNPADSLEEVSRSQQALDSYRPPVQAVWDSSLKTVKCDTSAEPQSWECTSGVEVWGRGALLREHYYPSTLGGSCADGEQYTSMGSYPDIEHVERIRLFTSDQQALTQGRPVTIEVKLELTALPYNHFLDLYATSSTTNPSWQLITTRKLSAERSQLVTVPYTLPTGSRIQAVRAALRRDGTASPCTTGPYDDRDDLVFTAAPAYVSGARTLSVAAGEDFSLAAREDGTLWGWGLNYAGSNGEYGRKLGAYLDNSGSDLPVQIVLLSGVKSVHATNMSSFALRDNGTVWAWGSDGSGQMGNGGLGPSSVPVRVPGLTGVTAVSTGDVHVLALRSNGTVWAWGDNHYGQLGDGTRESRNVPTQVSGLTQVIAISTGPTHSLALKSDGTVWAWGSNSTGGALGNGTTDPSFVPVRVPGLSGVTAIAAGRDYSLAIRNGRELWGWGRGPLGDTTNNYRVATRTYQWTTGTFSLAAGPNQAVAWGNSQGTLWSWGTTSSGGDCQNSVVNDGQIPARVTGVTGVTGVSINRDHTLFQTADGLAWAWGRGMGMGTDWTTSNLCTPAKVLLP